MWNIFSFACYMCIFFGEMSVKLFGQCIYIYFWGVHFLNWVVIFLLLSFNNSLCILNNSPLSVCLLQVFSPSLYVFFSFS